MIFDHELNAYADRVTVQPYVSVFAFTAQLYEKAKEFSGPKMDEAIKAEYSEDIAKKLLGKGHGDRFDDEVHTVEGSENIGALDPGFIMFASNIDWDRGIIDIEWIDDDNLAVDSIFPSQDFVGSEFEKAEYEIRFEGLKFDAGRIELLLPQMTFDLSKGLAPDGPRRGQSIGRPAKWNWDGAMAFIVSQAQMPDGLPVGDGAQARIEEMMASWFMRETGDGPAASQIRQRAALIMKMLKTS